MKLRLFAVSVTLTGVALFAMGASGSCGQPNQPTPTPPATTPAPSEFMGTAPTVP